MRYAFIIGLILLTPGEPLAAEKPIPQDPARSEKKDREHLEWNRRTTVGAYDKIGKKDPRWDKPAREAMELASRMFSMQTDPVITFGDVFVPAKAAVDAGCDDPYLLYLFHRSSVGKNHPGQVEAIRRMRSVSKSLAASRYPAFRRASVLIRAASFVLTYKGSAEVERGEARRDLDAAFSLLPESVAKDGRNEFWEEAWFKNIDLIGQLYRKSGMDAPAAYKRVDDRLSRIPVLKVLRLQYRGEFWRHYGWEARTTAFAPNVPAGGFELLTERLEWARKASLEAWKRRPDARTAANLIEIDKATGGDRATMELWFDRAMKADGDMRDACWSKLDWLTPKWHGTNEEMLAFGRACRDTKNWRAGITLLCAHAHLWQAATLDPGKQSEYLSSPEVWADITSVYEEYLKHQPYDHVERSKYASICCSAGNYKEADIQFKILGDDLTEWPEAPNHPIEVLNELRGKADRLVRAREKADREEAARKPAKP